MRDSIDALLQTVGFVCLGLGMGLLTLYWMLLPLF